MKYHIVVLLYLLLPALLLLFDCCSTVPEELPAYWFLYEHELAKYAVAVEENVVRNPIQLQPTLIYYAESHELRDEHMLYRYSLTAGVPSPCLWLSLCV